MPTVYANSEERATPQDTPRGLSYTKPITAAKEAVTVLELAERLLGKPLRRSGDTYRALCPLPDHEERSPSFFVYADNERGWWCFGCNRGGDVVDLYALANDHDDMREAAGFLLLEFGHELPQRPPSWFRKQERQRPIRDLEREAKVEALTRRLWGGVFEPIVATVEDPAQREQMIDGLWQLVWKRAAQIVDEDREREDRA